MLSISRLGTIYEQETEEKGLAASTYKQDLYKIVTIRPKWILYVKLPTKRKRTRKGFFVSADHHKIILF